MIRTIFERLARGRVIKRSLPVGQASVPIFVSPDSQLKYLRPGIEAFDAELLQAAITLVHKDAVVWDVGANVGVFSFAAASLAGAQGAVLAIEADIWLAQLLRRSAALPANKGLNVQVLPAAIAECNGVSRFVIAERGRASNFLQAAGGWSQAGGVRELVSVPTLTLDTLLDALAPPTVLKIDVEGAEMLVLRGATRVLREARPVLYLEVGEQHAAAAAALLMVAGYKLYDGRLPIEGQSPIASCTFNTIAIPC